MKRLAVSTTTIEAFNKFMYYDGKEESFLASVKKEVKETEYMRAGKAINLIINDPTLYYKKGNGFEVLGYNFHPNDIHKIIKCVDYKFPYWEAKAFKAYNIATNNDIYEVNVTGVVDQLIGYKIVEFKTAWTSYNGKWRSFLEEYNRSVQHVFYADIFNVRTIDYKVFVFDGLPEIHVEVVRDLSEDHNYPLIEKCTIPERLIDIVQFSISSPSKTQMRSFIDSILSEMLDYLEKKNLINVLYTDREYDEYF